MAEDSDVPRQVILTWQNDPSHTMTITWRTDVEVEEASLIYGNSPEELNNDPEKRIAESYTFEETSAWLHSVELTGLKPGSEYGVIIEHDSDPDKFFFRTAPDERGEEIVFVAGGDSRSNRDSRRKVNDLAASTDPDFVVFSGDMVAQGHSEDQWDDWLDDWHELMITGEGRRIPIVPAVGNHETYGGEGAPFYYNRFLLPDPEKYYMLDYGPDLSIVTLNTHTAGVETQNDWLRQSLKERMERPWKLVQYHKPVWSTTKGHNVKARDNWVPIFEEFDVSVVHEADAHTYKQTVPIRDGEEDQENGIIYIGDGGWGAPLREPKDPDDHWWLHEAKPAYHIWKFTLSADAEKLTAEPIFLEDEEGESFTLEK